MTRKPWKDPTGWWTWDLEQVDWGGHVVFAGPPKKIQTDKKSLTGMYLSGKKQIASPLKRRTPGTSNGNGNNPWITIEGANQNNLDNITAQIPIGLFVCVTGVSGAGKSTLINQILYPALSRKLHQSTLAVGEHKKNYRVR